MKKQWNDMAWYYKLLLIGSLVGVMGQGFGIFDKVSFTVKAEEFHKEDVQKLAMTQEEVNIINQYIHTNQAILEDREQRQVQQTNYQTYQNQRQQAPQYPAAPRRCWDWDKVNQYEREYNCETENWL